ncbi:General transcription factor 3C polypeptide 3 [Linum perenne]
MGSPVGEGSEFELDKVLELALDVAEEEEDDEGDEEEEEGGEEDDNEVEGEEVDAEQGADSNLLVSMEDQGSEVESFQDFGSLAYEALAEKKRRALSDAKGEGSTKKARLDDTSGATFEEIMEAMTYGMRKRKSRKHKKNGRRKGSKNKLSPEITRMLGDATVHYVHRHYEEAISVLKEVVRLAPHVPDSYHTLGLIYNALGNSAKAMGFYTIAARLKPKDSSLWKVLYTWHKEQRDLARAMMCLSRAIRADPSDVSLRSSHAALYLELGDYHKAAEAYEQILQICPDDVEVLKTAVELYFMCGQIERSVSILEEYLKDRVSEADFGVIDMLAAILIETKDHDSALKHIEHAQKVYYLGKELPLPLKIKAGICHAHLGDIDKAELFFCSLEKENAGACWELITEVADAFRSIGHFHYALKYYHMLDVDGEHDKEGSVHFKIAQCHLSLNDKAEAVAYFYKALPKLSNSVDARLTLASLLLEDAKEDDAISLLSPPEDSSEVNVDPEKQKPWWLDVKIKMKLCHIYRAKGKLEAFANTLLPLVRESLYVKTLPQKKKKRLSTSTLRKRIKILDLGETNDVFGGVRPLASRSDLMKAARARRMLKKKEELKAEARASGYDWEKRAPPLPNLLEDEEHHNLIIDLCKSLQYLERYWEALELISVTRKLASKELPSAKDEELQALAAQISYHTTDPKHSLDLVKSVVQQRPYSYAAWNCYYKITSRLGTVKHSKVLRQLRTKHKDCVPPIVISGHQFTAVSHHQDAAREYLEAYKLLPENPLINLCAGSALINLTLGFRLQNKHQGVAQGLAFLHNNLRLTENSQEALYNIARAYQQVGMVTLAVSYYEKVLSMTVKDYPIPKLLNENSDRTEKAEPGYCDLRREAAYNLHMIYMKSGAVDLARQVLKRHCVL